MTNFFPGLKAKYVNTTKYPAQSETNAEYFHHAHTKVKHRMYDLDANDKELIYIYFNL